MADRPLPDDRPGRTVVVAAWTGTGVFTVAAAAGVAEPGGLGGLVAATVSLVLFAAGSVLFLGAYLRALDRSRREAIGIGGLYFLAGSAPRRVVILLNGALATQTAVAVAAASLRPFTAVAFGMLVPMWGLGCNGWWAAHHGTFGPRTTAD